MNITSPAEHALLSPSASERWIACPASIRMSKTVERADTASKYAREGTAAHAYGERMARTLVNGEPADRAWKGRWRKEFADVVTPETEKEMAEHATEYAFMLQGRVAEFPNSVLLLEQRLPTGVPSCWGTSDAVIVSPRHVEIVDLKYGAGIAVDATENTQLMLYGVGALEAYGDLLGDAEFVRMTIFQPRLKSTSTYEMSAADLRAWRDSIIPIAELALGDNAPFGPTATACRWCPVAGQCRAQLEAATTEDFGRDVDLLSPEEMADALAALPLFKTWVDALEREALRLAYEEQTTIPGWKVVLSGGRRVVTDPDGLLSTAFSMGYSDDQVTRRVPKGIGELEKVLGPDFDLLGDVIQKTPGKPALVKETDRRPAINPNTEAVKEFSDE